MAGGAISLHNCRRLAELTGGLSVARANLRDKLQVMNEVTGAVYLLGYVPKNQRQGGNLRKIKVEVSRREARVRHRLGYYAREVRPYSRSQLMALTRTAAALNHKEPITGIPMQVEYRGADVSRDKSIFELWVTVRPPESFFRLENGRLCLNLNATYVVLSPDGRPVWETWDDHDLSLAYMDYQRALEEGIRLRKHFQVPARYRRCRVRVVLYDPENDKLASSEVRVKLK
jgi:hypothetical protein